MAGHWPELMVQVPLVSESESVIVYGPKQLVVFCRQTV
jgi:hypothetical protein